MKKPGNILIVDDNRGVLTAVQLLLKPHFEKIITLTSPVTLTSVLREETPSVVLLDMNFTSGINTGNEGLFWLYHPHLLQLQLHRARELAAQCRQGSGLQHLHRR